MTTQKSTSRPKANTPSKKSTKTATMRASDAAGPTQQRVYNRLIKKGMTEAQARAFSKNAGRGRSSRPITKKVERKKK